MPIITWITDNLLECVLIVGFTAVIVMLGILIRTQRSPLDANLSVNIASNIEETLRKVIGSVGHAADVSAVVKLVRDLDADPDALELIKSYPETVRAAAWLHRINTLGADLQEAQRCLSDAHTGKDRMGKSQTNIARCQAQVDMIAKKLDEAITASGQSGLRSV